MIWRQDLLTLFGCSCPRQGYCGSPLVVGDRLFISTGATAGKAVAVLDRADGHVLWTALDDPIGHATPLWVESGGTSQVIFFTGAAAVGLDPQTGHTVWRYPWDTPHNLNVATPIHADGKVFISSDYGTGAALFRIANGGEPETLWKNKAMQNHFSTSVLYEGHLYGFSEARLRCIDFETGRTRWDRAGLGKGSVLIADGLLFALGDHGELVLARATPEAFTPLGRCQLFDKASLTWTVPVLSGGRLFVRCENELVALDVAVAK